MIPSQSKSRVTSYSLSQKPVEMWMLLKHDARVNFLDSNCIEMGVEAIGID